MSENTTDSGDVAEKRVRKPRASKADAPALDELAEAYDGRVKIAKVNVDHNRTTAMKYHVRSIPMLLLFKDGQVQATQIGAVGKAQLSQMIDKAL